MPPGPQEGLSAQPEAGECSPTQQVPLSQPCCVAPTVPETLASPHPLTPRGLAMSPRMGAL